MKCLVVVDVQNDFITGALGTEEARLMLPRLLKKVREFEGDIYLTQDTHTEEYLKTQEGENVACSSLHSRNGRLAFPGRIGTAPAGTEGQGL
ncbi:hypothetical protein [Thermocaproicibacter melissae]|uniref:hypothetical protein n=1 Tax=Thermocaproicibacter melissae TaxID=2966552 RepID=UPI003A103199